MAFASLGEGGISFGAMMLFIAAALEGVSRSLYSGNNTALLFDILKETGQEDAFHHYFGRMGSRLQIALGLSGLLGGIAGIWSLELVVWLSIPPQIFAFILSFWFVEPKASKKIETGNPAHLVTAFRHVTSSPRLMLLILAQSLSHGVGEMNHQFNTAFANTIWPIWAIGVMRALANGLASFGFFIAGCVIDRFSHFRILIAGNLYSLVANLGAFIMANVVSPLIIATPSFFYGLGQKAKNHLFQENFNDEQRATLGSIVAFTSSIMLALVALLVGAIADTYGERVGLLVAVLLQVTYLPIYIKWLKDT
jgi:MFS family permease